MNAITKKLLSFVIVLAMVLSMSPVITLPALAAIIAAPTTLTEAQNNIKEVNDWITAFEAAETAGKIDEITSCPFCGESGITWTKKTGAPGTLGTSTGNVHAYLDYSAKDNSTLTHISMNYTSIPSGYTLCLYLNDMNAEINGHMQIKGTLNIFGTGAITKKENTGSYTDSKTGATTYYANLPLFNVNGANGVANIYGGTYESQQGYNADGYNPNGTAVIGLSAAGKINIYGGTFKNSGAGEVLYMAASGTVNMYGGEFQGGTGHVVDNVTKGGNVYTDYGTFNMYGGKIYGGNATEGGNIWTDVRPYFYAGEISNGVATGKGGNIYAQGVSVDLNGGTISGGQAENGGNVYHGGTAGSLNVKGATISNGVATGNGGNIYYEKSDSATSGILAASSGTVSGGQAQNGGNIYITNGRIASNTLSGVTVSGGKATSNGGNVYIADGNVNMSKGTISGKNSDGTEIDGYNAVYGGNVYIAEDATFTLSGGEIKDGKVNDVEYVNSQSTWDGGGNVANQGTFTMTGGTISGGCAEYEGGNIFNYGTSCSVSGGDIIGGSAANGGNIYARSKITVSGGNIKDGIANEGGDNIYARSCTFAMTDGTISSENAKNAGSVEVYNGTANLSGGTITGNVNKDGNALLAMGSTTVKLSGAASVTSDGENKKALWIPSAAKLDVDGGWTGTAYARIVEELELGAVVELDRGAWSGETAFPDGKLYQGYAPYAQIFGIDGGKLKVAGGAVVNGTTTTWHVDPAAAVTAAQDQTYDYLWLSNVTLANGQNITVDLAGSSADLNITVADGGTATVYGIDTENYVNGTYDPDTGNSLTVGTGVTVAQDTTVGERYISLQDAEGAYTFHRLGFALSAVTLRPGTEEKADKSDKMGMYYKATISCDDTLASKVQSYGLVLSLKDMPGADFVTNDTEAKQNAFTSIDTTASGLNFENGKNSMTVNSGLLQGILLKENSKENNENYSNRYVYANAYLQIDETFIMADTENVGTEKTNDTYDGVAWSLMEVLDKIDENLEEKYETNQKNAIKAFYNVWKECVETDWSTRFINIAAYMLQATDEE